ncbi:MAG: helix-turn-helix domain-containing protein, partial [Inconstantimicrobium porci]|uniref:winged helix-turn-helix domain-containing protein n=1 Tax=Inconstantimicrobium porci TaxID=2652291 RepID=UPI002A91CBCC
QEVYLSKTELRLLKVLMENEKNILTKEQLIESLWDVDGNFVDGNTLAVNIRRLREKIGDDAAKSTYIKNIRGVGYTWVKECIKK